MYSKSSKSIIQVFPVKITIFVKIKLLIRRVSEFLRFGSSFPVIKINKETQTWFNLD